jgi:hypothetical protein
MANQTINARDLAIDYLGNIELPVDFELPFLGTENLESIAKYYLTIEIMAASAIVSPHPEINISKNGINQLAQVQNEAYNSLKVILEAIKQAESKPLLATLRSDQWFNIGDEVMCFIQDNGNKTLLKKNTFVTGKVIAGRKYHEDYVSVFTNEKIHTGDNQDGRGLSFTTRDPRIMKIREYNYLKNHPDYLKMWITNHSTLLQFNPEPMLQAFAEQ